ncbi:hypothetical protein BU24DRAFT_267066 [Aaosphaeria arxii CBS 175.79]|uniref:Uncharacterized protein n=1 Tax=Aaosphaeria arxii CBS 175.79 TaxID=1450172 RepID=A0A6A5XGI0_9PLEO|nr:uncharacterized protein BU24DRAFT_267066 [Aaosphaeria arxii CBS 175.79]KAF2011966.1 hypothetical protein BU24DRAFT_267066 [Aaosphaeria arxii CBS 175.79]
MYRIHCITNEVHKYNHTTRHFRSADKFYLTLIPLFLSSISPSIHPSIYRSNISLTPKKNFDHPNHLPIQAISSSLTPAAASQHLSYFLFPPSIPFPFPFQKRQLPLLLLPLSPRHPIISPIGQQLDFLMCNLRGGRPKAMHVMSWGYKVSQPFSRPSLAVLFVGN